MWDGGHMDGGFYMFFWWLIIIIALVVLLRWILGGSSTASGKSPRQILDERYARGEIEREEYERKKHDLDS